VDEVPLGALQLQAAEPDLEVVTTANDIGRKVYLATMRSKGFFVSEPIPNDFYDTDKSDREIERYWHNCRMRLRSKLQDLQSQSRN
jgi:hypothetical protein